MSTTVRLDSPDTEAVDGERNDAILMEMEEIQYSPGDSEYLFR